MTMRRTLKKPVSIKEFISIATGIIAIVASYFAVPAFLNQFASADDLRVASTKAEVSLNEHINYIAKEIGWLEGKIKSGRGNNDDREQLKYLRKKLDSLQKIQRGGS